MKYFLILALLFWTPLIFSILKNILWDLYFWEGKEFYIERFIHNLLWDQELSNRTTSSIITKFILFALVSLAFISPTLASIGIFLTFALYIFESFLILEHILAKRLLNPSFKNPRNIVIILLALVIIVAAVVIITLPFLYFAQIDPGAIDYSSLYNNIVSGNLTSLPSVYIYLALAASLGLFLDLSSSFLVLILVFITSPFSWLKNQVFYILAENKLKQMRHKMKIVVIIGSENKNTTKQILFNLLKNQYRVLKTEGNTNSDKSILKLILSHLNHNTDFLVVDINVFKSGANNKLYKLLSPDVVLITDINIHKIGLFQTKRKLINAHLEILKYIKPDGSLIINSDNKYLISKTQNSKLKVSYFGTKQLSLYTPGVNITKAYNINVSPYELTFDLVNNISKTRIRLRTPQKNLVLPNLAAIAIVKELRLNVYDYLDTLSNIKIKGSYYDIIKGDNDTSILNHSDEELTYKKLISAVNYASNLRNRNKKLILVTNGIKELGKYKKNVYVKLLEKIRSKTQVLITNDPVLIKIAKSESYNIEVVKVESLKDFIYSTRKYSLPGDIVLVEGRYKENIMEAIKSNN